MKYDYNVLVIGAGSAGLVTSYIAATLKAKVGLIERHKMGGDCLNTGCVPSKALIRSAKVIHYAHRAKEFGLKSMTPDFDFADVMERVQTVIKKIEPHDSIERYTGLGVECITGEAKIVSPHEVEVNGKVLTTRCIVVATGARPFVPPLEGLDQVKYLTSDNLWEIRHQPKKLIVLGGGPIGSELAQSFNRLGTDVTMVERGPRILPREDDDVAECVIERFKKEGVHMATNTSAKAIRIVDGRKYLVVEKDSGESTIEFDEILIAVGRRPNTSGFGLEELGVELRQNGTIKANDLLATNYSNIFVCGDVTGPFQFTHTAAHQAYFACLNSLFHPFNKLIKFLPGAGGHFKVNYNVVPWATYTDPEVATVGLTEKMAQAQGIKYEVTTYGIDDLDRAIADGEDHGMVKVLTKPGTDKILGATIVASTAADMLGEFVAAMKHGFGLNGIMGTIHAYPSMLEANKFAAGEWKKARKPEGALNLLKKFHDWRR